MPIETTRYACNGCFNDFDSYNSALECENKHLEENRIIHVFTKRELDDLSIGHVSKPYLTMLIMTGRAIAQENLARESKKVHHHHICDDELFGKEIHKCPGCIHEHMERQRINTPG